jgi:hypothetical protein
MQDYASRLRELGIGSKQVESLDQDWLARYGLNPKKTYVQEQIPLGGKEGNAGTYTRRKAPYDQNVYASTQNSGDLWSTLAHEYRHAGVDKIGIPKPNYEERIVRAYDQRFADPTTKQWANNYLAKTPLQEPQKQYMQAVEGMRQQAEDNRVLRGPLSPAKLMGHMVDNPQYQMPIGPSNVKAPLVQTTKNYGVESFKKPYIGEDVFKEADAARQQFKDPAASREAMVQSGQLHRLPTGQYSTNSGKQT